MLPVSVEESKAQRIQRQQARFRDRGGAFIPSENNPLVNILLSRTISGESPSKPATKSPHRHRSRSISPSKAKRNKKASLSKPQESSLKVKNARSNTNAEAQEGLLSGNAIAGPSTDSGRKPAKMETKKKVGPTRKGKGKTKTIDDDEVQEAEEPKAKPAPKRKGRPPKTKAHPDIDADPEPPKRKARTTKEKSPGKSKVKAKMAEVLQSDDEGTLVEAPRPNAPSKRKPVVAINYDNDDESTPGHNTADAKPSLSPKSAYKYPPTKDAPLNRVQAKKRAEARKGQPDEGDQTVPTRASRTQEHSKRAGANEEVPNLVKSQVYGSLTVDIPMRKSALTHKRSAPDGEDAEQPTKRAKLPSAKFVPLSISNTLSKPNAEASTIKKPNSAMKKDAKRKKERQLESDDEDHIPKKPKKARFVEDSKPLVHISSEKQKENVVSRKTGTGKPTSKSKSKGPPRDVLERIKTSATLHPVEDSDADPLDCLS